MKILNIHVYQNIYISEAAAERPPDRDFGSKRNSRTSHATTQRISSTAHQHISTTNNKKPTTSTATNKRQRHQHHHNNNHQQQMHSHKNSNNTSLRNNSGNTRHQATKATTVPSSCIPECTVFRIDARACTQEKSKAASRGIKQHGKSVAASGDSASAIPTFGSRTAKRTRVTPKPRMLPTDLPPTTSNATLNTIRATLPTRRNRQQQERRPQARGKGTHKHARRTHR